MQTLALAFKVDTAHAIIVPVGEHGVGIPTVIDPRGLAEAITAAVAPVLSAVESWGQRRDVFTLQVPCALYQAMRLHFVSELPYMSVMDAVFQCLGAFKVEAIYPPNEMARAEYDAAVRICNDANVRERARADAAEARLAEAQRVTAFHKARADKAESLLRSMRST